MISYNFYAMSSAKETPKVITIWSAGGVFIRYGADHTPEVLLGYQIQSSQESSRWTLPKGTPEKGETVKQTALREVTEETGLKGQILCGLQPINYRIRLRSMPSVVYDKTVYFFLMDVVGGSLNDHDHEFSQVKWIKVEEACQILRHQNEINVVHEAVSKFTATQTA